VHRSRKEQQQHVRDVLAALGGSPEELERAHDPSATGASLGSRIAAYSRLARSETASAAALAASTARPLETELEPELTPRFVRPKRERRRWQRPPAATHVRHAVLALVRALRGAAIAFLRSAAHAVRQTTGLLARFALRVSHELRVYLPRAAAVFRRLLARAAHVGRASAGIVLRAAGHGVRLSSSAVHALMRARPHARIPLPRPRRAERSDDGNEPAYVAEAVLTWVQAASHESPAPPADAPEDEAPSVELEPEVGAVAAPSVTAGPSDGTGGEAAEGYPSASRSSPWRSLLSPAEP
jgi:hypothetical protein